MKTSIRGIMAIMSHEAIVLTRYKDSVGVWTIGVGHTDVAGGLQPSKFTGELTVAECYTLLKHDISKYEKDVQAVLKHDVNQQQFDALVSFHFNTGLIGDCSIIRHINNGNFIGAGLSFDNFHKPPSIIDRRNREKLLFTAGIYPKPYATMYPATKTGRVIWNKGKLVDLLKTINQAEDPVVVTKPPVVVDVPIVLPTVVPVPQPSLLASIINAIISLFTRKKS